jgi:hypothetical protein
LEAALGFVVFDDFFDFFEFHIFDLVFCFRRRRGGFDLEIQSHKLDFSSTTFFQKDENNFGGPQSRMNTGAAGGDHFPSATKMVGIISARSPNCSEHAEDFAQIVHAF